MISANRQPRRHRSIALLALLVFMTGLGLNAHAVISGQAHQHPPVLESSADDAHAEHAGTGGADERIGCNTPPTCCQVVCQVGTTVPPVGSAMRSARNEPLLLDDDVLLAGLRHPPPLRPPR